MRRFSKKAVMIGITAIIAFILIVAVGMNIKFELRLAESPEAAKVSTAQSDGKEATLAESATFKPVAETEIIQLSVDQATGHFIAKDKRNGHEYTSFPDPEQWKKAGIKGLWKQHTASPIMFQTLNFNDSKAQPKESDLLKDDGTVKDFEEIENGYRLTYDLPNAGLEIPVQVTIKDDYIETTVLREGIKESINGLIWIRLFPFFEAVESAGQDGYMFVPDGGGALITFKEQASSAIQTSIYQASVYGHDKAFRLNESNLETRSRIVMPVYGMKSGSTAFIAVLQEGEEYADIVAAPAGVYTSFNWITSQMNYRSMFYQTTNRKQNQGYTAYNEKELFGSDRTTRYYLLPEDEANYSGMAGRYRDYLMEDKGIQRMESAPFIPLYLTFLGGDQEKGILTDRYIKATTTNQAEKMLRQLSDQGVKRMEVTYLGWQKNGVSAYGKGLPVDNRIGGNRGMERFVELAHELGASVYLDTEYGLNNTGAGGFKRNFDGIVNLAGRKLSQLFGKSEEAPLVSNRFVETQMRGKWDDYEALDIDGISVNTIGRDLFSDYNTKHKATRSEAKILQQSILKEAKDQLQHVQGNGSGFYSLPYLNRIQDLDDDYSHDLLTDTPIPFAQMALHGLISYSSGYANNREEHERDMLRDIEYGSYPAFIFTGVPTSAMTDAYAFRYFSTQFSEWESEAVKEYQIFNELFSAVQDQFIVSHRSITNRVKETIYENGTRILVNYGEEAYLDGEISVPALGYTLVKGEESS